MRNGEMIARFATAKGNRRELVGAMIGREPASLSDRPVRKPGRTVLRAENIVVHDAHGARRPKVDNVNIELREGEIVGLFGLVGAGRTELAKALFGAWPGSVSGACSVMDRGGLPTSPRDAISRGMAMLTEDRKQTGLIEGQTVNANVSAASVHAVSRAGFVDQAGERARNETLLRELDLRPFRPQANVEAFSGGNQQKILLARWIATQPKMLIVDEPTYGVDIGARAEIYRLLDQLAAKGCAILMISSDMEEILAQSDRVVVMYKGQITGQFDRGTSRQTLMASATGDDR